MQRALPHPSHFRCAGCGHQSPPEEALPFSCANRAAPHFDHVMQCELGASSIAEAFEQAHCSGEENPFLRYRQLSHSYRYARRAGMSDEAYTALVSELDDAVAQVDGRGFRRTPFEHCDAIDARVKNETVNVSGSHKARHLMGIAIHLKVLQGLSHPKAPGSDATLAIASCGNAALAAAVVARAMGQKLQVFVPPWANESVVARLDALGAERVVCERRSEDPPGDPCYHRFREAVADGAIPFSCQGGDNALTIVGGHTLGWELVEEMRDQPSTVYIQVGGGALASGIIQAFRWAAAGGLMDELPRFVAVQSQGGSPLVRAYQRLSLRESLRQDGLVHARRHREHYMWPWESEPKSIASGILDDETYDWFSIAEGLIESRGEAIAVSESTLAEAQRLGVEACGIQVDATGTAGLAGLLHQRGTPSYSDDENEKDARPVVLFTGAIR